MCRVGPARPPVDAPRSERPVFGRTTDYAGHPDAVAIPLFAWVKVNQRELMENLVRGKEVIGFEADVLDNSKVDLSIKLLLSKD